MTGEPEGWQPYYEGQVTEETWKRLHEKYLDRWQTNHVLAAESQYRVCFHDVPCEWKYRKTVRYSDGSEVRNEEA